MADEKIGVQKVIVGKYVCPVADILIPVSSLRPPPEMDCPLVVECCPACGERHEVGCDDLLEADDTDLE